jgi:uncharacterized protein YjdB
MNVRFRFVLSSATAAFALGLVGCGSGGGDNTIYTPVTGYVSKAPVTGATCRLYNSANQVVATVATSTSGAIDFGKTPSSGALYAQCSGGSYKDEATGQTVTSTTLSSGTVLVAGTSAKIIITPLTQLAFTRAGGDPSKITAQAAIIAQAFGLSDVNILTTVPTDLNTSAASVDAAGRYGTILAAIAQLQKNQGQSLADLMTTLGNAISTNSSGAGAMNAATSSLVQQAAANLTDSRYNSNPAVQTNAANTSANVASQMQGSADSTPFANSMVLLAPSNANVTMPLWGQTYTLTAAGGNLGSASLAATGMSCGSPSINTGGTTLTAQCTMPVNGSQVSASVQVNKANVQGLTPSASYYLSNGTASCQAGTPIVASITPTSLAYAAQGQTITVNGCNLGTSTAATLDGVSATPNTGASADQLAYSFNVTNTRNSANAGTFAIGSVNQAITYTVPSVTLTAASPSSLIQGAPGSSNWTLTGTGLYTGIKISLDGSTCSKSGTANALATTLTGVDCSNVTTSPSGTSSALSAAVTSGTAPSISISLGVAPTPTLAFSGNPTSLQLGADPITVAATSASSGAVSYSGSNGNVATVSSTGTVTPVSEGSVTITATQAAVQGQYAAASVSYTLTITARSVSVLTFATPTIVSAVLGDADVTNSIGSSTCNGIAYNANIAYSSGDTTKAALGQTVAAQAMGQFVLKAAGSPVITATASAQGTCAAASQSYTLNIGKATPSVAFNNPTTTATIGGTAPTNTATVSAPTNKGSGTLPSTANLALSYTSSNTSVATVSGTGLVTLVGGGTATITASLTGDANYLGTSDNAAIKASYTLTVNKATPTLTAGNATLSLSTTSTAATANAATLTGVRGVTAPSGSVTYSSDKTSVATVDSTGKVTPVSAGTATITASYAGDSNYTAATSVTTTVTVTSAPAFTYKLPDTGITASQCYTTAGANTLGDCTSAGATGISTTQDGMVGLDVSSTDNTDGKLGFSYSKVGDYATTECVKDNLTGLVWEGKPASGTTRGNPALDPNAKYTNYDSTSNSFTETTNAQGIVNAVNATGLCGFKDWRLPTTLELQTIVDYSPLASAGKIDANWFPNTMVSAYWTSSPNVANSTAAWTNSFSTGGSSGSTARSALTYVRLVRSASITPVPSYTISTDGQEVTDNVTGLIWRRCPEGMSWSNNTCTGTAQYYTHEQALTQAQSQATASNKAWRLPNVKELSSISQPGVKVGPSIDTGVFLSGSTTLFWTSSPLITSNATSTSNATRVDFSDGAVGNNSRSSTIHVRLVR